MKKDEKLLETMDENVLENEKKNEVKDWLLKPKVEGFEEWLNQDEKKKSSGGGGGTAVKPTNPYATQMNDAMAGMNKVRPTYTDNYAGRIGELEANAPVYQSKYQPNIDGLLDRLENRQTFRYNMSEDPLYRQLAARYMQQGKQAMQDTVGQISSMNGGYGSSYATTAGSQAYQQHINGLNDEAMNLYQLARAGYDRETDDMHAALSQYQTAEGMHRGNFESDRADYYNRLAALRDGQSTEYNRYMDQVGLLEADKQRAWEQYKYWNDLYEKNK